MRKAGDDRKLRWHRIFIPLLALSIAGFGACTVVDGFTNKQFVFENNDKQKKLVYKLPKGRAEENVRVGENNAMEQFFYFGDGSVFYVARHIKWQTVNQHRIDELRKDKPRVSAYSGKDRNGLFWKEIKLEEFFIGYSYVPGYREQIFNEALSSVKIR